MTAVSFGAQVWRAVAARVVIVATLAVAVCVGTVAMPSASTAASSGPTIGSWHGRPGQSLVAIARPSSVTVHSARGTRTWKLSNPNSEGATLVFLVVGARRGSWEVEVPARPNESLGWISTRDVYVGVDNYSTRVSLSKHRLYVYRQTTLIHTYPVGLGRPSAPTPTGKYYLTEVLQSPDPHGPYAPYAYGTSAFSKAYSEFEGGPGQIGLHGTNEPSSVGRNVSHGCIRMRPRDDNTLAHQVPAGTPLIITR